MSPDIFFDLWTAAGLHLLGAMAFARFEVFTPFSKKLRKVLFLQGVTALLALTVGRPWSILWVVGMMTVGMVFHLWWTRKHGIHPLTAEPRAKYYALRGWSL